MFNWHVKCWFCVPVLFVGVFCSVIWCNKRNYCHTLLITVAILFSKVDSNKLWINVKNKMTLIDAKFDVDLINISEVTSRKTKWPRVFGLPCRSRDQNGKFRNCQMACVSMVANHLIFVYVIWRTYAYHDHLELFWPRIYFRALKFSVARSRHILMLKRC